MDAGLRTRPIAYLPVGAITYRLSRPISYNPVRCWADLSTTQRFRSMSHYFRVVIQEMHKISSNDSDCEDFVRFEPLP
jgi:hypothetical protein